MDQQHMSLSSYADDFIMRNPDITELYKVHNFVMTYEHGPEHNPVKIFIVVREYFGSGVPRPFRSAIDYKRTLKNGQPWGLDGSGDNIETALLDVVDKIRMNLQGDDILSNPE